MFKDISVNGKTCDLMKAVKKPKYGTKTVLTNSCWEYVSLFLKRQSTTGASDALLYWEQAHSFYAASKQLPDNARPLTSYYCILNASKALLRFKNIDDTQLTSHGVSTVRNPSNTISIKDAKTSVKGAGVLTELGRYYNCMLPVHHYSISDLLYNIPCVHRAFCITFSKPEIFIPIEKPVFVKKDNSKESWLKCVVKGRYAKATSLRSISPAFEHDIGVEEEYVLRMKKRFYWDIHKPIEERKQKMARYHERARQYLFYIYGDQRLWYIKKSLPDNEQLNKVASPVLIFIVFHWLSELVRYTPKLFDKYMKSKQNWLLHEFIYTALDQFVDEISCEITGQDIMCTGYRN